MLLKKGIVRKTFLFSVLLILLVLLISFTIMYFVMPGYYFTQKEKTLRNELSILTLSLQSAGTEDDCVALISDFAEKNNVTVLSFDSNENILSIASTPFIGMRKNGAAYITSRSVTEASPSQTIVGEYYADSAYGFAQELGEGVVITTMQVTEISDLNVISAVGNVGTDIIDYIVASGTLQPIDEAKGVILTLIPYVLAVALITGLVMAGVYAKQITKPILKISSAALRMQQMEPDASSGISTNDELGQLSINLDALYAKLRENIDHLKNEMDKVNRLERSKTEMMQSASHELKTPISALNGMIEGMIDDIGVYKNKDKYLMECKNQVDKLSSLVGEILRASKSDILGDEAEVSEFYLDELAERAVAENIYLIHENNLHLERELNPIKISTDAGILYRAISNIMSNAIRYTPPGGKINITVSSESGKGMLIIENECDPISPEELPKMFEPFYTRNYSRDKSESGTGLGLYIVKRSLEQIETPYEALITDLGFRISLIIP